MKDVFEKKEIAVPEDFEDLFESYYHVFVADRGTWDASYWATYEPLKEAIFEKVGREHYP